MIKKNFKILFLRHGETCYNERQNAILNQFQLDQKKLIPFIKYLKDPLLISGKLSEKGKEFTKEQSLKCEDIRKKIKYVVCSPNSRALQTVQIFFDSKNNKEIKFVVSPYFRSVFESQYDIPLEFDENKETYKEFDFSLFDAL